jgi:hypothetical protein
MTGASQDWHEGDLAVCINNIGWWEERAHGAVDGPVLDQVLRVAAVYSGLGLEFDEFPDQIWPEREFRRIEPDHSAANDPDIVALIKGARVLSSCSGLPPLGRNGAAALPLSAAAPPPSNGVTDHG